MIRKANKADLEAIYAIAQENSLSNQDKKSIKRQGFLVSDFTKEDYAHYIETLNYFYVSVKDKTVTGFVFAYEKEDLDKSLHVNQSIINNAKNPFVVIKQICIANAFKKQGLATELYHYIMNQTNNDIYLAVTLKPYNAISMNFHHKLGFSQAFEVMEKDGIKRGVLFWDNPRSNQSFDKYILIETYKEAINLYKHEDSLNWQKLNHLFYISASLVAALALTSNLSSTVFESLGMIIISIIGMSASVLFGLTIHNGILYLSLRKQKVIDVERLLKNMGGTSVLDISVDKNKKKMQKSSTTLFLKLLPGIIFILWLAVFIIGIVTL